MIHDKTEFVQTENDNKEYIKFYKKVDYLHKQYKLRNKYQSTRWDSMNGGGSDNRDGDCTSRENNKMWHQ
jgi:hypothetical protein